MVLLVGGVVMSAIAVIHACNPTPHADAGGEGGGTSRVGDGDGHGDGDQSGVIHGGDVSSIVGPVAMPAPNHARLQFVRLLMEPAGSGTDFRFVPGKNEVLMSLREGKLARLRLADRRASLLAVWEFTEEMVIRDACGPSNLLLDQEFDENHFIYVTYCASPTVNRLVRYTLDMEHGPRDPAIIFETVVAEGKELWRRFGSLDWIDRETLWILVGDHEHAGRAHDPADVLGSLVMLRPSRDPGGSGHLPPKNVPKTTGSVSLDTTIHAYGFRAPWRATRDELGRYFVGDVGQDDYEELNLVSVAGQDFGWDLYTGPCAEGCKGSVSPLALYDRSPSHRFIKEERGAVSSESRAIWVGQIYQRPALDRYWGWMTDVVAFGDLFTGVIRGIKVDERGNSTLDEALGALTYVTQWRTGPDGYIYVLDLMGNLHVALLEGAKLL